MFINVLNISALSVVFSLILVIVTEYIGRPKIFMPNAPIRTVSSLWLKRRECGILTEMDCLCLSLKTEKRAKTVSNVTGIEE